MKHFDSVTHTSFGEAPESILEMRLRTVLEKQRSLVFEMADRAVTEAPDSLVSQALSYFQRATLR